MSTVPRDHGRRHFRREIAGAGVEGQRSWGGGLKGVDGVGKAGARSAGSVLVIGGGVIGLCCAYALHRRGFEVTLVEAGDPGGGASAGNGGWVCPSLSAPVPGPGVLAKAVRWMLNPNSPLLVRPSWDPSFWAWMVAFASHCNRRDHDLGLGAVAALASSAAEQFRHLEQAGVAFEVHHHGLLLLFLSRRAAEDEMVLLGKIPGLPPATFMERSQLSQEEPATGGLPAAGVLAPGDFHVRPEALTSGLSRWLEQDGVRILAGTRVVEFETEGGRAVAAVAAGGVRLRANEFVLAAGVDSARLSHGLGSRIPLQGGKGYSVTFARSSQPLSHAIYLSEARVAVSPYRDGVRVLGTMELGSDPARVNPGRVAAMLRTTARYLPELALAEPSPPWAGLRPMVPDGLPVIGPLRGMPNVIAATGHAMLGVTLAPATGELVADMLEGRPRPAFTAAFSPARF
ncbi:MAG TPA: FAD-dependent oxidoreductase [Candidatus Nanopelagicaceae bacterium]|nr:FAD-dependent oxidoreductase [Candidatus Nanopelagicaceae bacterium]